MMTDKSTYYQFYQAYYNQPSTWLRTVADTLSTHPPNEEYIGERQQTDTWSGDAEIVEAFYAFLAEIQRIEKETEKRNRDTSLKNRCGAGVVYHRNFLHQVPNSMSI
ncbi:lipoxygenase 1 [Artemisia annua]|uniref:Lipoxygenase 1 n=1 Tax=Artemisia annua TaxID=35608 RepID=A0A2U1P647_ARTAN|nr:lipoxygenase 1 [Artemisia annua]